MSIPQDSPSVEEQRLADSVSRKLDWQRWGTYLPERQWGTVREDDSADGNAWAFTYDVARYKAYRWGEDGLLGWTDRQCRLCYSTSFWNGKDACLKERFFGLTNAQGNHGADVSSGDRRTLLAVAVDLATRLSRLFFYGPEGNRLCHGIENRYAKGGPWEDRGTSSNGWTAFVSLCLEASHRLRR